MSVCLLFFIRFMSILAWLGFFAVVKFVTVLFFTVSLLILNYENWSFHNLNPSFNVMHFFIGNGIIVNSYNCHIVIPAVERIMKHPQQFQATPVGFFEVSTSFKISFSIVEAASFGLLTEVSVVSNLLTFRIWATTKTFLYHYICLHSILDHFLLFSKVWTCMFYRIQAFWKRKEKRVFSFILITTLHLCFHFIDCGCCTRFWDGSWVCRVRRTLMTIVLPINFYL